jgi:hypothetical protein
MDAGNDKNASVENAEVEPVGKPVQEDTAGLAVENSKPQRTFGNERYGVADSREKLLTKARPVAARTTVRPPRPRRLRPGGIRHDSPHGIPDAGQDLIPRDAVGIALLNVVEPPVEFPPLGVGQGDGRRLGAQAVPQFFDELQPLSCVQVPDVDGGGIPWGQL